MQQPASAAYARISQAQDRNKAAKAAKLAPPPVSELTQQQQACLRFPISESPSCKALAYSEAKKDAAPAAEKAATGSVLASGEVAVAKEGGGM